MVLDRGRPVGVGRPLAEVHAVRAPFQDSAAGQSAALLEIESVQQPVVERPPGRRAEIQVPVDLLLGRFRFGRAPSRFARCPCRPGARRRCAACRACRGGPTRPRRRRAAGFAAACPPETPARSGGMSRPGPGSGRCSSCRASRSRRPCRRWPPGSPPWRASSDPVAINTASISGRASSSRRSRNVAQSWLPYFASTVCLTASRRAAFTSQTAAKRTSGCCRKHPRSYPPRLPMPMPPTTICSLGGGAPSFPSAEAGMNCGRATRALAPAAVLRNRRRENLAVVSDMVGLLVGTWLASDGQVGEIACAGRVRHRRDSISSLSGVGAVSSAPRGIPGGGDYNIPAGSRPVGGPARNQP